LLYLFRRTFIAIVVTVDRTRRGKLKDLDREDVAKRPGGIVLRMTWKV